MVDQTRRNVLKGAGALLTGTALAGCNDGSDNPGTETETPTETPYNEETTYEIELSVTDELDLSGVYDLLLNQYSGDELAEFTEEDWQNAWETVLGTTGIRDEDHLQLEYTITEYLDGEEQGEVEPDHLELSFQGENGNHDVELGPEIDNAYDIACTELHNGENHVTLTAEVDGETVRETATIRKIVPETHLVEGWVDGERVTPYNSPFRFDTQQTDSEEIARKRREEHPVWEDALEYVDQDRIRDIAENGTKKELLEYTMEVIAIYIGEEGVPGASSNAQQHAATEQEMIQQFTDFGLTDVYANGFNNPADITSGKSGNHGSKAFYLDGDWFHQDTMPGDTAHASELDQIDMIDGSNEDYVSILAEFEEGEMEELRYSTKMSHMTVFHASQVMPSGELTVHDLTVSDSYGSTSLDMIRDNVNRGRIMNPVEAAANHHFNTGNKTVVLGTPDEPIVLSTNSQRIHDRIEEDPSFQDTGTILSEAF